VDQLYPGVSNHGELAGIGALFATHLRGDDTLFDLLATCLARHELARTPEQLGLTDEQFVAAVLQAPTTRPDRYTILEHVDLDAAGAAAAVSAFLDRLG
jgi:glycerol-1-phosphate dehydrogenase [NAD(P)+]